MAVVNLREGHGFCEAVLVGVIFHLYAQPCVVINNYCTEGGATSNIADLLDDSLEHRIFQILLCIRVHSS